MRLPHRPDWARDWVAVILAVGVATALNVITVAAAWTAIAGSSDVSGGLSENATQVIAGLGGGMIAAVGSFLGFRAGEHHRRDGPEPPDEPEPE